MAKVYIPPYIYRLMDYIYLSDYRSSIDFDKFSLVIDMNYPQNGIQEGEIEETYQGSTHVFKLGIPEESKEDLSFYFNRLFPYIQKNAEKKQRTLILSHNGKDRNATMFSAYLIRNYKFSLNDLSHLFQIHSYSPQISHQFVNQLSDYAKVCSGLSSTLSSSQKIDEQISKNYLSG